MQDINAATICNSHNMGTSALPDMYARSPRAARVPML